MALMQFLIAVAGSMPAELALIDQVVQSLEGQVGIDCRCAITKQQGEVMHLARLATFDHKADLRARALADQVMMEWRRRRAAPELAHCRG